MYRKPQCFSGKSTISWLFSKAILDYQRVPSTTTRSTAVQSRESDNCSDMQMQSRREYRPLAWTEIFLRRLAQSRADVCTLNMHLHHAMPLSFWDMFTSPSGKLPHSYGKSQFSWGKLTIYYYDWAIFIGILASSTSVREEVPQWLLVE